MMGVGVADTVIKQGHNCAPTSVPTSTNVDTDVTDRRSGEGAFVGTRLVTKSSGTDNNFIVFVNS
jgi:hypothetical protein